MTIRDVIRVVVSSFAFTSRFVDDLLSINNPLLSHLLYTSQQLGPLHGVYDPDLRVLPASDTAPGLHHVNYLDLQFVPSRVPGGDAIRLDIKLYDKRLEAKFARLKLQRFPHSTSALSTMCKLNIIVSRYTHMHRVLTIKGDFCWHPLGQRGTGEQAVNRR